MPTRRPRLSWAPVADLSQTPACMSVFFWVSRRVSAMISAIRTAAQAVMGRKPECCAA